MSMRIVPRRHEPRGKRIRAVVPSIQTTVRLPSGTPTSRPKPAPVNPAVAGSPMSSEYLAPGCTDAAATTIASDPAAHAATAPTDRLPDETANPSHATNADTNSTHTSK